jgi:hypothetical protein
MQGDWAADGTTRGGADITCTLVVDSFWQRREGVYSRHPQNCSSKLYLKSCKKLLGKSSFPRIFLHNLRYNLRYNKSYLKLYQFCCDRMGVILLQN